MGLSLTRERGGVSPTTAVAASRWAIGDVLDGRYKIVGLLGTGGMGLVYEAERLVLGDRVAIKCLRPETDCRTTRERFLVEARAAAHVRHPNVVQVFDFGDPKAGLPYIVMELVRGTTLAAVLAVEGSMLADRALSIFGPACAAVEAGHRRGVIHRDLKPGNIMLAANDDGSEVVKVLDFGLARMAEAPRMTSPESVAGTTEYLAPELVRGEAPTTASDVFALGAILYEMVTGKVPFGGATPLAALHSVLRGRYVAPESLAVRLPAAVAAAIRLALDPRSEARPVSPEQLARLAARDQRPSATRTHAAKLETTGHQTRPATVFAGPPPASLPGCDAPRALDVFVGRERELASLSAELNLALHGRARIAILRGEPGAGKSRLAERFAKTAADSGAEVLTGRFFEYEGSRPPPCDVFLTMLQERGEGSAKLSSTNGRLLREAASEGPRIDAEGARWRLKTALADAFAARAGHRPLVLLFDDLQGATPLDLAVIEHLHKSLGRRGTLIVGTLREHDAARPPLSPWLASLGQQRELLPLELEPFTPDEVRTWLDRALPGLRIRTTDAIRIVRASGGSPWFLSEIVSQLIVGGRFVRDETGWTASPLESVEIPRTVAALLEARIATLEPELTRVLEAAAVIGDEFRIETVRAVADTDEVALEDLLGRAENGRLISPENVSHGNELRFASEALRRVLYDGLKKARKRTLHRRAAEFLVQRHARDLARVAPVLAWHYAAVGDDTRALAFALRAAEDALARHDDEATGDFVARAHGAKEGLEASGRMASDRDSARLLWLSGALSERRGRSAEATAPLCDAARLARATGDVAIAVDALTELSRARLGLGELGEAEARAREAAVLAEANGDRPRALAARVIEAGMLLRRGEPARSETLLDTLLGTLDGTDPLSVVSLAHRERAWQYVKRGAFADAEVHAHKAHELARAAGDMLAQHHAISVRAAIRGESGDHEGAIPLHTAALELSRRLSLRRREAIDLANLGEEELAVERTEDALFRFEEALRIFVEIGDRACEGDCSCNLGRALLSMGRLDEAERLLSFARARCLSTGRHEYSGLASVALAEVALARGRPAVAMAHATEAGPTFRAIGSHHLWRALDARARSAHAAGETREALVAIDEAKACLDDLRGRLPREGDHSGFERDAARVEATRDVICDSLPHSARRPVDARAKRRRR